MNILFIHQNPPGQFIYLANKLSSDGHKVSFLGISKFNHLSIDSHIYFPQKESTPNIHSWLIDFESQVIRGESVLNYARNLKNAGYSPDLIYFHPGWGEALFINEIWPKAKKIAYCEYYYNAIGFDIGFDSEFYPLQPNVEAKLKIKNLANELQLPLADLLISPTQFQKSSFPKEIQKKIDVIHDGIDTTLCKPNENASISISRPDGLQVTYRKGDPVLTFVNRNLEPYRGYHILMRALPVMMAELTNLTVLIIGDSQRGYGAPPQDGTWKDYFLKEVCEQIDPNRIFFLGRVPYQDYIKVLQLSMVHIYFTYPFVLGWSLLEAMSVGACIVGSKIAPVEELIKNHHNGILVNFFDHDELAKTVISLIKNPTMRTELGSNARQTICNSYDLNSICLPKQISLINSLF